MVVAFASYLSIEHNQFRRILWVYSATQLQASEMRHSIVGQNIMHFGRADGFEVRAVNDLSAYDWLSNETIDFIKRAHQRSAVEIPVSELLRLALLYQYGGVSIRVGSIVLMHGIAWTEELINGKDHSNNQQVQIHGSPSPEVVMLHRDGTNKTFEFMDDVIIARPRAKLFDALLNDIARIIQEGVWPYSQYNITTFNNDTEIVSFPGIVNALLNIYETKKMNFRKQFNVKSKYFGVENFNKSKVGFIASIEENKTSEILNQDLMNFEQQYGKTHMLQLNITELVGEILQFLKKGNFSFGGEHSLLKTRLIMAEGNKWLTVPAKTHRKVHFCIVSLKPHDSKEAQKSAKDKEALLRKQSFGSWNLVHFANGLPSASKKISERTVLVNASVYEGLNLQRAVTKHCRNDSVVFLLDHDQTLSTDFDLHSLQSHFRPVGNYAAFFKLKIDQKVHNPQKFENLKPFRKERYQQANQKLFNNLANHFRAFTVQIYRFLPKFNLAHIVTGRYFNREVVFFSLLQTEDNYKWCEQGIFFYYLMRLERLMDLPRQKVYSDIIVNTKAMKQVDASSYQYRKFRNYGICENILMYIIYSRKVDLMVVFNDGREETGVEARNGMPELIPRKIHQVWVKGKMPAFKQFLVNRLKQSHPDYTHYLWTEENITRQNFPQSYDKIQSLIKFNKRSPYNKLSMIADLIRHESTYRHGGFYFDTNYMLLSTERPLDKFLTYFLVIGTEHALLHRSYRQNSFFGCSQFNPYMKRLQDHQMISSRNWFSKYAHIVSGPGLFGKIIEGDQELSDEFFQPGIDQTHPHMDFNPAYSSPNLCEASQNITNSQILFKSPTRVYSKKCLQIYYYSVGLDFFKEGGSWLKHKDGL